METNIVKTITNLRPYCNDIVATEYYHWSNELKDYAFSKPVYKQAISPEQLRLILSLNPAYRRYFGERAGNARPIFFDVPAQPADRFPKLGVMSWKEIPEMTLWSKNTYSEISLRMLFGSVTIRMASILHAWVELGLSTHFYLFPYKDLNNSIELRFFVSKNETRFIEKTVIGNVSNVEMNMVLDFVNEIKSEVVLEQAYVDIIITKNNMKLLEINPVIERMYGR